MSPLAAQNFSPLQEKLCWDLNPANSKAINDDSTATPETFFPFARPLPPRVQLFKVSFPILSLTFHVSFMRLLAKVLNEKSSLVEWALALRAPAKPESYELSTALVVKMFVSVLSWNKIFNLREKIQLSCPQSKNARRFVFILTTKAFFMPPKRSKKLLPINFRLRIGIGKQKQERSRSESIKKSHSPPYQCLLFICGFWV